MEEVERVGRKCRTNTVSGSFWTEVPDEYCIRKFLPVSEISFIRTNCTTHMVYDTKAIIWHISFIGFIFQ